ncbi:MAG TPA: hypothetical protein VGA80_13285, partial [Flavobacteriaceae bacterium]
LVYFDTSGITKYFNFARISSNLYLDVREKNYFSAILNLNVLLEKTVPNYEAELIKTVVSLKNIVAQTKDSTVSETLQGINSFLANQGAYRGKEAVFNDLERDLPNFKQGNLNTVVNDLEKIIKFFEEKNKIAFPQNLIEHYKKILPKILKYGNLAASIAKAESSDEVQAAIEAIALPAGSASIKRKSKYNIALNAYVGLSPGMEHNGDTDENKFSFGVNAPIGVAISWGHGLNKRHREQGSSSAFLSLIDLGAVTNYRFGDSETEDIPEIKLENIFAPGLYYVYGVPNWPISLGFGGQLGPLLRKIKDETIDLQSKATFSLKFFIAVDIPLLNFYTKSR